MSLTPPPPGAMGKTACHLKISAKLLTLGDFLASSKPAPARFYDPKFVAEMSQEGQKRPRPL
jgi:hypothetical protein